MSTDPFVVIGADAAGLSAASKFRRAAPDRAAVRIDTLSTALEAGMTVGEVEQLDLAYAPPFSPVWDPILVAAKVLNGQLDD